MKRIKIEADATQKNKLRINRSLIRRLIAISFPFPNGLSVTFFPKKCTYNVISTQKGYTQVDYEEANGYIVNHFINIMVRTRHF